MQITINKTRLANKTLIIVYMQNFNLKNLNHNRYKK